MLSKQPLWVLDKRLRADCTSSMRSLPFCTCYDLW